jgi:hypothetical protein
MAGALILLFFVPIIFVPVWLPWFFYPNTRHVLWAFMISLVLCNLIPFLGFGLALYQKDTGGGFWHWGSIFLPLYLLLLNILLGGLSTAFAFGKAGKSDAADNRSMN